MTRSTVSGLAIGFGFLVLAMGTVGSAHKALAGDPGDRGGSCDSLWYARNAIYARNGYCFKTDRGIATFGAGCFPPYGRLSGGDQRRVSDIKRSERRLGCTG